MAQRLLHRLVQHKRVGDVPARFLTVSAQSSSGSGSVAGFDDLKASSDASEILKSRKKLDPKVELRRQYDRSLAELRKQYAEEEAGRRRKEEKKKKTAELQVMLEKGQRAALREERTRARALEAEEGNKASRLAMEKDRAERAERRLFREKLLARKQDREKAATRQQSSVWIEEKELERRILEAMADPYYLAGHY